MQENKCFHGCSFTMFMVYTQPLGRGIKPDEEYGNVPLSFTTEFCYSGFHDSLGYQFFQLEQKCKAMASTAPAVLLVVNNHHFPPNYGLCCAHSWPGSTPVYQQLCSQKQMQMKQFQGNYVADIVSVFFFFQDKTRLMKASPVKLNTSITGKVSCDTSRRSRRGGKAKRCTAGRKVGSLCGVMRKGKAAAEKPGRMLIQAGEQLGKMREVVKSTRRSWKISVRDTAVSQMWQKPHYFSGAVCTVVFP